ncbi:MAG: MG2 domain-containing protein [Candidatus Aminicenantes bacterium]|nr:MG2 domain-containing protein [Candidatus Aminicenantes bacterium]
MRKRTVRMHMLIGILVLLAVVVAGAIRGKTMQDRPKVNTVELWAQVAKAEKDGLPQTAVDLLKKIYTASAADRQPAEALRALTRQLILEATIEGNQPGPRLVRLQEEIGKAPESLKPMLRIVLARWYWSYFSRNRWRFTGRTATEGVDDKDFTTWDLPRLLRTIDGLYQDIFKDAENLKKTPIAAFLGFLLPGDQPSTRRPTLYDFAAFEALEFYASGEQAAARPEDAFEITADSAALAPAAEFLKYEPETTDQEAPALRALRVFQGLLAFHKGDADGDAAFDIDLQRLDFAKASAGDAARDRYIQRLRELVEVHAASPLQASALARWAEAVHESGDFIQAYALAKRGADAHPKSIGAANCRVLMARITAREFDVRTEGVVAPDRPARLVVEYRNVTRLHFRAVREDFAGLLAGRGAETLFWLNDDAVAKILTRAPQARWSADLKPTKDYQSRRALVEMPALKPGFYYLLASHDESFANKANKVEAASFWVSDLGFVAGTAGLIPEGLIVRAASGDPVPGADIVAYEWDYNKSALVKIGTAKTDAQGAFFLQAGDSYRNRVFHVRTADGGEIAETQIDRSYDRTEREAPVTVFFTDRSIYRPGQTIFFKGLCLNVDRAADNYRILPKQSVRVVFRDANREEIAALSLTTNDFGSFSGSFSAPTDRLTGAMTIQAENPAGQASVRVEEYKRPKFEVKLAVPEREFKLGETIEFAGAATTYAGAPVDGASVKYRVVREVRYPWWWFYWRGGSGGDSQEIAHGTVRTDVEGKFTVRFPAKPDASVPADPGTVFTFAVTADVTDGTGETRSDEGRVRVGFASLEASLSGSDWQEKGKPVVLTASTLTLNGKRVAAKGVIEVSPLLGPERPEPADLIGESAVLEAEAGASGPEAGFARTADWRKWPAGAVVVKRDFETVLDERQACRIPFDLGPGAYQARLRTKDKDGVAVETRFAFLVLDPAATSFPVKVPFHAASRRDIVDVGDDYELWWGTGYAKGPILIDFYQNGRRLERAWASAEATQGRTTVRVAEKHRGGFTIVLTMVKDNRLYRETRRVLVPWSNKRLDLRWKTFRSKLRPGQAETWSLEIKGPKAAAAAAEMVASLYDASLDQFLGHGFPGVMNIFRSDTTNLRSGYSNRRQDLRDYVDRLNSIPSTATPLYIRFPEDVVERLFGFDYPSRRMMARPGAIPEAEPSMAMDVAAAPASELKSMAGGIVGGVVGGIAAPPPPVKKPAEVDLSAVKARKNLSETAFFYPQLLADKNGTVTIEFKIPEALTRWKFLGFAHDKDLRSGSIEAEAVTQKELMVQPNPPRFLREGDVIELTVKVTNMTETEQAGAVELAFFDPRTEAPLDAALANKSRRQAFTLPAKQSRSFAWPIAVPDGLEAVGYKAVAAAGDFSDGEEGAFPVLSRRMLVRESIPLWISDKGEKSFRFDKLADSGGSGSLRQLGLTVQMASNPAWYAIQALPYLMAYPYECAEQIFNRLYANGLAGRIAASDPKIRRVFDLWKGTPALVSNLEKNQDLKSVLLQESPWVLEAKNETQAKHAIGLLFDENTLASSLKNAYGKLAAMQLADGSWPWFPGGRGDSYITLYLVTGFGRLKRLGVTDVSQDLAVKAIDHLDEWIDKVYREIVKDKTQALNHLSPTIALFLYGRSFFLKEKPVPDAARKAFDYFLGQGAKFWLPLDNRQSQAHLAVGLKRFGDAATPGKIMRSMKERSKLDPELGRYWAETELAWWWYRAPIETQAMMIEAFDEVLGDAKAVEECKIWLLKQKQTQDWKTTKATADAIYALVLKGTDILASDAVVEVRLGGQAVKPETVEAGTGFYEKRYAPGEIRPAMGEIVVKKTDPGIAWGGVHWQYLEDIGKITPHAQNPLTLKKTVFVRRATAKGPVIEPVRGPLAVGDTVVVRIELRTDRDLEYVHMKDHRGSGLEPVNVLSQYKFQDGLAYYEATKDTASHFFIDYLPKGTYVFEYQLRVVHRGTYQNGMAHIECMYAPEFNSHSGSVEIIVR